MPITDMKYCPRGQHHVLRTEFGSNINNLDGLQAYCKACMRKYVAERKARKAVEYALRNSWKTAT